MHDHFGVEVLEGREDRSYHELGFAFGEDSHLREVVPQVPTLHQVHDDVETVLVLKGIHHVDDKLMAQGRQELPLIQDRIDTPLGYHAAYTYKYIALDISFIA